MRLGLRRRNRNLSCEDAVRLVTDYLDDALAPRERARFVEHLAACPDCPEHLKQIKATIEVTGQIRVHDLEPAAQDDLIHLYRGWLDDQHPGRR